MAEVVAWCTLRLLENVNAASVLFQFLRVLVLCSVQGRSLLYICCSILAKPVGWRLTMRKVDSSLIRIEQ